jgi:predicted Zn-dependent protease
MAAGETIIATYFDGLRPLPRRAALAFAPRGLELSVDGGPAFLWDYRAIRLEEDGSLPLRFHREESGARTGEVLELADEAFAAALKARCPALGGSAAERSRTARRIVLWSFAAIASVVLMVLYGLPALATALAPLVPWRTEVALGAAVEGEALRQLGGDGKLCGTSPNGEGARALAALVERLTRHAALPGPVQVKVLDAPVENAFALPGGRIVFMRALIERAESPDEVAGVLAHELGHVAHRDAMRAVIHAGGLSFLIGTLLGDFTGAGALVIGSRFLLTNRYSRSNESDADAFAVEVMTKAGGDVRALSAFLRRAARQPGERRLELLLSHPVTDDRIAAIEAGAPQGPRRPLLDAGEWQALRAICAKG